MPRAYASSLAALAVLRAGLQRARDRATRQGATGRDRVTAGGAAMISELAAVDVRALH
jgi:hypothetical protein